MSMLNFSTPSTVSHLSLGVHCRTLLASKGNNSTLVASLRTQKRFCCSPWDHELDFLAQPCVPGRPSGSSRDIPVPRLLLSTGRSTTLDCSVPRFTTSHPCAWRPVRGLTGDSEGAISSEDMILDEQTLMMDLQKAIKDENYAQAAEIRDNLRVLQEDNKASVVAANARFYKAFRYGDLMGMRDIWSKGEHVCCVHPGAGRISGYDLVMESWELVFGPNFEFPLEFDLKNVEVHVRGDVGYVTCKEIVKTKGSSWGEQVATNVFEKVDGEWFICIHHASHVGF